MADDADVTTELESPDAATTQAATTAATAEPTIDELKALVASKDAELEKFRRFEEEYREFKKKAEREAIDVVRHRKESEKHKDQLDAALAELTTLKAEVVNSKIDAVLKDALAEAKAKSPSVLKLVDRSKVTLNEDGSVDPKSVAEAVKALKASDPDFFGTSDAATTTAEVRTVVVPPVHKAGEGTANNGFENEIKAAKSQQQIEAVLRKYGR